MEKTQTCWIKYETTDMFPIQNLPYGVLKNKKTGATSCFSRISNKLINLSVLEISGLLDGEHIFDKKTFSQTTLNSFANLGRTVSKQVRAKLTEIFTNTKFAEDDNVKKSLEDITDFVYLLPVKIQDYTDFYSSRNHAFNVGSLFRPTNPLQPNWVHLPVGYHGRSSSVVVDGTPVRRPRGQVKKSKDVDEPLFSECKRLDYEAEMGVILGKSNELGKPIKVNEASDYVFGFVMLNDWSARDIQTWEYVPLGPFNAKNFATTISPWVITPEALEPFKLTLPEQDPKPLKYLDEKDHFSYDIPIDIEIKSKQQKEATIVSTTNYKFMYWTANQQIAHHSVTGCPMNVGDLLGSGTISGTTENSYGCLLEQSKNGQVKIPLGNEERVFLQDGDFVNMKAYCKGKDYLIGFGDCSGEILEALNEEEYY